MNRTIVWLCVLAAVAVAAAVAFFALNGDEGRSAVAEPPARTPVTTSSGEPGLPAIPTPSLSPGSEEAARALEIQRIIFEVTQEAIKRPKDDRMSAEEIEAAINTRITELKARP